jgi:hypothetical protein
MLLPKSPGVLSCVTIEGNKGEFGMESDWKDMLIEKFKERATMLREREVIDDS